MLVMSVVRGVGGVCDICLCLARGRCVLRVSGRQDWVWAFPFLEEHGESGSVFWLRWCVWCSKRVGGRIGSGRVVWCYVCVCCESGLSVLMAGPGICILC